MNSGLLSNTLPYKTVNALEESDSINTDKSSAVRFSIRGADPYGLGFYENRDFSFSATSAAPLNYPSTIPDSNYITS